MIDDVNDRRLAEAATDVMEDYAPLSEMTLRMLHKWGLISDAELLARLYPDPNPVPDGWEPPF